MTNDLATLRRLAVPYLIVTWAVLAVYVITSDGEWNPQRIAALAAGWLLGTAVISLAYLVVRSQTRRAGDNSRLLLRGEAEDWRRYARQQESSSADSAGLTREQLKELQDQHLEAFQYVLITRDAIKKFSPAPAGSPTAEYDEGLREAAIQLRLAAMRFRGQITDGDQAAAGTTQLETPLSRLRSVIGRAMYAARNFGEVFQA